MENIDILINILNNKQVNDYDKNTCNNYLSIVSQIDDPDKKREILLQAFISNPRNGIVLVQLGILQFGNPNPFYQYFGHLLIEKSFDKDFACPSTDVKTIQGRYLAFLVARYNYQMNRYKTSEKFFQLANTHADDDTHLVQLATHMSGYPESINDAKRILKNFHKYMDLLINKEKINIKLIDSNIYNSIILSGFNLEIYYEADFRSCMSKYYQLTKKIFPELDYYSPHLFYSKISKNYPYKIGIASAFFNKNNSVIADFGGVITQLPKDKFDVTYIYLIENENKFIYPEKKNIIINSQEDENWLNNARDKISNLELDLILYLDSTMSPVVQKTLMSKLAHVQAVSHGHPVTSGVDSSIMDYYVSWGGAELDYEIAKNHYTEKLILLPGDKMHQYYQPRTTVDEVSKIDNKSFKNINRKDFSQYIPEDGNWYTCMQKPFKRHPEFDYMLESILQRDPQARIILHDSEMDENKEIFNKRLNNSRVHYIPAQPHHKLMALYKLSDIILDSYHAGGCTTTREALEIGAIVVTLPSKYLGGRWSLAYYNIIGVLDVVAKDKEDYINLALKYALDIEEKNKLKQKILNNIGKIFYSQEAIESWSNVLETMIQS